jgi:hypothetical protein
MRNLLWCTRRRPSARARVSATDLFSFGVVLYEMAKRRLPSKGNTSVACQVLFCEKTNLGLTPSSFSSQVVIKHANRQGHLAFRRLTRVSEVCSVRRNAALEDTTRKRNERDPNRCAIPSLCASRPAPSRLNLWSVTIRVVQQAGHTATNERARVELVFRCLAAATPGVRSAAHCQRHLLCRAEPYELDVLLDWHPARNRLAVTGQLLDSSQPEIFRRDVRVALWNFGGSFVTLRTNEWASFAARSKTQPS